LHYLIPGESGERPKFSEGLADFCVKHGVPRAAQKAADLALEEHLTNIVDYGYEAGDTREISVEYKVDAEWFEVVVEDNARPFNPLAVPPVDTSLPLEQKPIGGLGIPLMRHCMDELLYAREGDKNILRMRKRLAADEGSQAAP
jgi:serine/threonine-protein kinase RsbW